MGTPKIRWVLVSFSVNSSAALAFAVEIALAQVGIGCRDDALPQAVVGLGESSACRVACQDHWLRNQSVGSTCSSAGFRAAVVDGDLDQDVFGRLLGILHEHVEVAVLVEHARIEQFVLELVPAAAAAGLDKVGIRERRLRILVEVLHVRMGRRAVEVEVVLLDVLAVIALAVGQAEQALLQDRVLAVPEGQREAEPLLVVGDAGQPVFAPAIGARAGLIVGEVIPGVAALAVVLAHRSPLSLAQVRPPFFPGNLLFPSLVESDLFRGHNAPMIGSKR